jgi:hypothetical protein
MRLRLDTDVQTQDDLRAAPAARESRERFELFDAVYDDVTDATAARSSKLVLGLTGAVERQPSRRKPSPFGSDELAERTHVNTDRALRQVAQELNGRKGFSGV